MQFSEVRNSHAIQGFQGPSPDKSAVCPQTAMLAGISQFRSSQKAEHFCYQLKTKSIVILVRHTAAADRASVLAIPVGVGAVRLQIRTVAAVLTGIAADLADAAADFFTVDFHAVHIFIGKVQQIGILQDRVHQKGRLLLGAGPQGKLLLGSGSQGNFKFFHDGFLHIIVLGFAPWAWQQAVPGTCRDNRCSPCPVAGTGRLPCTSLARLS